MDFTCNHIYIFYYFFTRIHPIILSDTDDWFYAFNNREAVPLWKDWNPSRVFAEILMPFVSEICAYVIYPVIGDFFRSLTLGYAIVLAVTITVLISVIRKYLCEKYHAGEYTSIITLSFFILCHFWIFRVEDSGNNYMFKTIDACTYFYYVIPNIINCIMVIYMKNNNYIQNFDNNPERKKYERMAVFVTLLYFCIFSNIWASIIIASFVSSNLLFDMVCLIKKHKFNIVAFIKKQLINFTILIVWIISQIFEMGGGRAEQISAQISYKEILNTLNIQHNVIKSLNNKFVVFMFLLLLFGLYFIIKDKDWYKLIEIIRFSLAFVIIELYLVLSCAKAGAWYISRADVFYGMFFFIMMIGILCFTTIMNHLTILRAFIPLVIIIIFLIVTQVEKHF